MRSAVLLLAGALAFPALAAAQFNNPGMTPTDVNNVVNQALTQQVTAVSSVPSPPGAGVCRSYVIPSNLITSAGVAGTSGTCSVIMLCGTSPTYTVNQFNTGNGC